jgi:hypothetical protein
MDAAVWMWAHVRCVHGRRASKGHRVARKDATVEQALQALRDAMADTGADEGTALLTPPPSDLHSVDKAEEDNSEDTAHVKDLILRLDSMEQQLGLVDT